MSTPRLWVSFKISATGSAVEASIATSAPIANARLRRCASGSTDHTRVTPESFSIAIVSSPIGPAPNTTAVSPGRGAANFIECTITASGSTTAPSAKLRFFGSPNKFPSGRLTNSRKNPGSSCTLMNRIFAQTL